MLLGEDGAVHGARPGTLFVDMSTIGPADARRIGARAERARPPLRRRAGHRLGAEGRGRHADDHGRRQRRGHGARDAAVRGDGRADRPRRRARHGPAGRRSSRTRSAPPTAPRSRRGWCVGRRTGVDLEALLKVMGAGSADSTMLQLKGKPMLEHDFTPLFKLDHMLKDMRAVPAGGARGGRRLPVGGARRRALRRRRRAADWASRTSPRCSRSSRASTTRCEP